jgi:hypothetical protein
MKDIAQRYLVSAKTVERVLDSFFKEQRLKPNYLPKHLLIDEFKGTLLSTLSLLHHISHN